MDNYTDRSDGTLLADAPGTPDKCIAKAFKHPPSCFPMDHNDPPTLPTNAAVVQVSKNGGEDTMITSMNETYEESPWGGGAGGHGGIGAKRTGGQGDSEGGPVRIPRRPKAKTEAIPRSRTFEKTYLKRTWVWSGLSLLFILAMEAVTMILCFNVTNIGPLEPVNTTGTALKEEFKALTSSKPGTPEFQKALPQVLKLSIEFPKVVAREKAYGDKVFNIQLVTTSIVFVLVTIVAVFALIYRDHKVVKSRGKDFLAHAFVSGYLLLILVTLSAASFCLQFTNFPAQISVSSYNEMIAEENRMVEWLFWPMVLGLMTSVFFMGALIQRQRVIYHIFRGQVKLNRVINYWKPFPLHFPVAFSAVVTIFLWRYATGLSSSAMRWASSALWPFVIGYCAWLMFYTYKTRNAHLQFSDFYSSMRIFFVYIICVTAQFITVYVNPRLLTNMVIGWVALGRIVVLYWALDAFVCQAVQLRYGSLQSTSRFSSGASDTNGRKK